MPSHQNRTEIPTYRPSKGFRIAAVSAAALFALVTIGGYYLQLGHWYLAIMGSITAMGLGGVVEAFREKIELREHDIRILWIHKTELILYSDIERVSAEGGGVAVKMKSGPWKKFPLWLGSNMSVRHRVAAKLK